MTVENKEPLTADEKDAMIRSVLSSMLLAGHELTYEQVAAALESALLEPPLQFEEDEP